MASCAALCTLTIALAPSFEPLPGASPARMPADHFDAARAQGIAPLALGADSGQRMAATDAVQPLTDTPERPSIDLTAALGSNGLASALERAGVNGTDSAQIVRLTADVVDPAQLKPGTALTLTLGRRPNRSVARPLDALAFRARFDMKVAFARDGVGVLQMQRLPIAIDHAPLRVEGRVGDSLYRAARAAGAPAKAVETYIRALDAQVPMRAIPADARFDMILERARAATGEVEYGKLLYVGLTRGERRTRMIEWTIGGRTQWFDATGVGEVRQGFVAPVAGARKTSGFGMRMHPLLRYSRFHQGTDYGAVHGSPIRAVTDGVVVFAGRHGGHGNMVKLRHAGGLGTGYAHMSRISVAPGTRVRQGQVIGLVGSTGLSTGPHLHFEVYRGGGAVNPATVKFASRALLSGSELAAFRARLARLTGAALAQDVRIAGR